MRLRSILRKRQSKRGRGRGSDPQRWLSRYFADLGLYLLTAAHGQACQSAMRRRPTNWKAGAEGPPVRFGGRGGRHQRAFSTPIGSLQGVGASRKAA